VIAICCSYDTVLGKVKTLPALVDMINSITVRPKIR